MAPLQTPVKGYFIISTSWHIVLKYPYWMRQMMIHNASVKFQPRQHYRINALRTETTQENLTCASAPW